MAKSSVHSRAWRRELDLKAADSPHVRKAIAKQLFVDADGDGIEDNTGASLADLLKSPEQIASVLKEALDQYKSRAIDLFRQWDVDGSGTVDKGEFFNALHGLGLSAADRSASDGLFDQLDADFSGKVEYNELQRKLNGLKMRSTAFSSARARRRLVGTPRTPRPISQCWNERSGAYEFEPSRSPYFSSSRRSTLIPEDTLAVRRWSCLKGTYEYVALDGTKWDDRNLEATVGERPVLPSILRSQSHLFEDAAEASQQQVERASTSPGGMRSGGSPGRRKPPRVLPKHVAAVMRADARRARQAEAEGLAGTFSRAAASLKRKLASSLNKMLDLFTEWDADSSGSVSKDEFRRVVNALGWSAARFAAPIQTVNGLPLSTSPRRVIATDSVVDFVFDEFDVDGSGEMEYKEYVRHALRSGLEKSFGRAIDLFIKWDEDKSGEVDVFEFSRAVKALGFDAPAEEVWSVFNELDKSGDGKINFRELNQLLRQGGAIKLAKELRDGAKGQIVVEPKNPYSVRTEKRDKHGKTLRADTIVDARGVELRQHHGAIGTKPLFTDADGDGLDDATGKDISKVVSDPSALAATLKEALDKYRARTIDLFRELDTDTSGTVEKNEFHQALKALGLKCKRSVSDALFDEFDSDGSGKLEYAELDRFLKGRATGG